MLIGLNFCFSEMFLSNHLKLGVDSIVTFLTLLKTIELAFLRNLDPSERRGTNKHSNNIVFHITSFVNISKW